MSVGGGSVVVLFEVVDGYDDDDDDGPRRHRGPLFVRCHRTWWAFCFLEWWWQGNDDDLVDDVYKNSNNDAQLFRSSTPIDQHLDRLTPDVTFRGDLSLSLRWC